MMCHAPDCRSSSCGSVAFARQTIAASIARELFARLKSVKATRGNYAGVVAAVVVLTIAFLVASLFL